MRSHQRQILRILVVTVVAIVGLGFVGSVLPPWTARHVMVPLISFIPLVSGVLVIRAMDAPTRELRRAIKAKLRTHQEMFAIVHGRKMTPEEIASARRRITFAEYRERGKGRVIARGVVRGVQPPKGHPDGPQ